MKFLGRMVAVVFGGRFLERGFGGDVVGEVFDNGFWDVFWEGGCGGDWGDVFGEGFLGRVIAGIFGVRFLKKGFW